MCGGGLVLCLGFVKIARAMASEIDIGELLFMAGVARDLPTFDEMVALIEHWPLRQ